jgi:hypothetical protein
MIWLRQGTGKYAQKEKLIRNQNIKITKIYNFSIQLNLTEWKI